MLQFCNRLIKLLTILCTRAIIYRDILFFKEKKMKKFLKPLALILAVTMLCQMLVISAVAETKSGNCGANATYSLNTETGVLTLDGTGATDNYDKFGEEGWTPIWKPGDPPPKVVPWKKNADSIKTVVVGEGITKIGNNAFSQCYNIQNIFFFSKDTQLSSSAFETSKGVYTIHLYRNSPADSYFSSEKHAKVYLDATAANENDFQYKINPDGESVTITYYNGQDTEIVIPSAIKGYTVSAIGGLSFGWCKATNITIPESVAVIEDRAFTNCENLHTVTFNTKDVSIGSDAFFSCFKLKTVLLYKNSTADSYFSSENYNKLYFSEKYTVSYDANGGEGAPEPQTKSENVALTLSDVVPTLEGHIFAGWATSKNGEVAYLPGDIYTKNAAIILYAVWEEESGDEPIVPNDFEYNVNPDGATVTITKYIGEGGDVAIPSEIDGYSVTSIGPQAFHSCKNLTSVAIPDSVTLIEDMAFGYCSNLTDISFGSSLNVIDSRAFENCTSLTVVTIPSSVTSLVKEPFFNCISITEIKVDEENEYYCDVDGVLFTKDMENLIHYPVGSDNTEYEIPTEVKNIDGCAFYNALNLKSITIPDSVESIGAFAFFSCEGLENVTIPSSMKTINRSAFAYCYALTSISIPEGVTSIDGRAFVGCSSLASIVIPKSVTSIESDSFAECSELGTIYLYKNSTADEYFSADEYTKVYLDGEIEDLFGDANSDGEIDITDVVLLAQYIAAWDVVIDEINSDCNMDNTINIKDVVLLAQYLAGWDVSLG